MNKDKIKEEFDKWEKWDTENGFPNFPSSDEIANWWLSKIEESISKNNEQICRILKQIGTIDTEEDMDRIITLIKNSK